MENSKTWIVEYDHKDGRQGKVKAVTRIEESGAFKYGNGKVGELTVDSGRQVYDLRYAKGDLHKAMLREYFGKGLVEAVEA